MASKQSISEKIDTSEKERWGSILHHRICSYVKIYTSFLCYATYLFVAHRNLVSAFDLRLNKWSKNFEFDDTVRCISLNNP